MWYDAMERLRSYMFVTSFLNLRGDGSYGGNGYVDHFLSVRVSSC